MMKNIRKTMAAVLALAVFMALTAGSIFACAEAATGLVNPLQEGTKESVLEATGFSLTAPEGAQNVRYFTIYQEGSPLIAEMRFEQDGKNYTYRMQASDKYTDISGFYYKWENESQGKVEYVDANLFWNAGKEGMILWYDVVPGVMYSLTVDTGADPLSLCTMADLVFVPLQASDGVEFVKGPLYGTIVYVTGSEFGMKQFNGDDFYKFRYDANTIENDLRMMVGEDIMVMYTGDLENEPVAALVTGLTVTTGDDS